MPEVFIQAPPDKVFRAISDLTRHIKWAKHNIVIEAGQEGAPAVGNTYTSSERGKTPDRLTVTEITPNKRFRFHSVMSRDMGWEVDFTMTARPEGEGTVVTGDAKVIKFPILMLPLQFLIPLIGPRFEKKRLENMKVDLELEPSWSEDLSRRTKAPQNKNADIDTVWKSPRVKAILERPAGAPIDLSGLSEEEIDSLAREAKGMWADHPFIKDSVEWVRELRRSLVKDDAGN